MLRLGQVSLAILEVSTSTGSIPMVASLGLRSAWLCRRSKADLANLLIKTEIVSFFKSYAFTRWKHSTRPGHGVQKYTGEIVGYAMITDAKDFILHFGQRQAECMALWPSKGRG